ncbi:molybdate ABC transporter substrate-binding protein [Burkholderia sp. MR1-5-21]
MIIPVLVNICLIAFLALIGLGVARADDLKVFSTPTLKSTLAEIAPEFERQTGRHLAATFDNAATLKRRIEAREAFDVAILLPDQIDDLIRAGRIVSSTRADIAKATVGMAVRADAPAPDIGTVDSFRRALMSIHSLSWSPGSASGAYLIDLLGRLGVADTVRSHLVPVQGGDVVAAVAGGTADATVITVPNIVGVPGVRLAGLLPPELQHDTVYTAGIATYTEDPDGAKALIRLLMSAEATAVLHTKGLERPTP